MGNILYVNKPKGMSSFDVCFKLRRVLNTKKIGHTGTLDPNATGVMIILSDSSTKAAQFLKSDKKEYKTRVLFGVTTDTLDIGGKVISKCDYVAPSKNKIQEVLKSFLGISKQTVPLTSAKKLNGKKLYEYQLENKNVELPIIDIEIFDISLDELYDDGFTFTCLVSSGTYIRSLVRDILFKLSLTGTVKELCRTSINDIKLTDCDNFDDVLNGTFHNHELYDLLVKRYPIIEYDDIESIKNGKAIKLNCEYENVVLVNNKHVLAVYSKTIDEYRCVRGLW